MSDDGEETVYLVQVPTDFFATYCMDNKFFEVYEVNDQFVTICFRDQRMTDGFVKVYAHFNWYMLTMHIRHDEPIVEWSPEYVKYRYGFDMMFGQE